MVVSHAVNLVIGNTLEDTTPKTNPIIRIRRWIPENHYWPSFENVRSAHAPTVGFNIPTM